MALMKGKFSEVPKDAVILTEEEAISYQVKILKKWKHPFDTFAYNYGPYILGGASFLSGLYLNSYFRNKFRLFHYGRASSYLPICVIPATVSVIVHTEFVMRDVLLQKGTCPVCIEMRASALQSLLGCVFPAILGPLSSLALAHKYNTYDVPYITQEPRKVLKVISKTVKPLKNVLFGLFLGQALLASVVTYMEGHSVNTVNRKLELLTEQLENS